MRKIIVVTIAVAILFFISSCKTSDSKVDNFKVLAINGYSFANIGPSGLTSINLYFSVANKGNTVGTIISWKFRVMHNIVPLVEINGNNLNDYNLGLSGNLTIPEDEVVEININTRLPFMENAIPNSKLTFDPLTPTGVILDLEIKDADGNSFSVTKKGGYTYEKGLFDSKKYSVLGNWKLTRIVNSEVKAAQKITFVGTKRSGSFVIYNLNSGKSEGSGSFTVQNYKNVTLRGVDGTTFWGEFNGFNLLKGTMLKGTDAGTWNCVKL